MLHYVEYEHYRTGSYYPNCNEDFVVKLNRFNDWMLVSIINWDSIVRQQFGNLFWAIEVIFINYNNKINGGVKECVLTCSSSGAHRFLVLIRPSGEALIIQR